LVNGAPVHFIWIISVLERNSRTQFSDQVLLLNLVLPSLLLLLAPSSLKPFFKALGGVPIEGMWKQIEFVSFCSLDFKF
jgi:hypothetical protein